MEVAAELSPDFEAFAAKYLQEQSEVANADFRPYTQAERVSERACLEQYFANGKQVLAAIEPGLKEASLALYRIMKHNVAEPDDLDIFAFENKLVVAPRWLTAYRDAKTVIEMYRDAVSLGPL
jgi:hypothetical protein